MELVERFIEVDGATLQVFESGHGLLLGCVTHGYGVATLRGNPFVDALSAFGRVVLVNGRGAGASSPGVGPIDLSMSQLVDDLEAMRRALGGPRWVFAGTSAGGWTGLLYALRYPDALAGLVISSTTPDGRFQDEPDSIQHPDHPGFRPRERAGGSPEDLRAWLEQVIVRTDRIPFYQAAPPAPGRLAAVRGELRGEPPFARFDVSTRLGDIRTPTLVLCGRQDNVCPLRWSEQLHAGIPNAELAVIEECGHFIFAEAPDEVRDVVRRFVAACVLTSHDA